MSIYVNDGTGSVGKCDACKGAKKAPIAALVSLDDGDITFLICQECGRDLANAIGFMCIREGGWSRLEPRKRNRTTR